MNINLEENWQRIRTHFSRSFGANMHVSIASVNEDNLPTITPIGSLFLNDNQTGFYFEKFATKLNTHSKTNKNICVLAVNTNKWFWLKSLFKMKFSDYPAVKLYGELGVKREATASQSLLRSGIFNALKTFIPDGANQTFPCSSVLVHFRSSPEI